MESNNPNDDGNRHASTSLLQEHDELALTISQNGAADCSGILHSGSSAGADCMSFSYMSLPVAPPPWENMNATYQSCTHGIPETGGNLMADFMRINNWQNPQIDPNSINIKTNTPINFSPSAVSFPERNMRGMYQSINHDCIVPPDNMMDGGTGNGSFHNPQMNRNFMLTRGNAAGGYQMVQGGEAKSNNTNSPQVKGNFVSSRGSTPMLYHTQNSGYAQIDNNVKINADQFGRMENFDGSFLSLGIGGNTEARSKATFSSREIASKLEEGVSPKLNSSHVRQTTRSSSSLGHNLVSSFPNFQSNAGGFSSHPCNVGGWTSSKNDDGIIHGSNTGLSLNPFHISQAPQVNMQHNLSMPSNRSSGFVRDARYADLDPYQGFRSDQAASSGAFCSSSSGFLSSGQIGFSGLASESANSTWITTQTTSDQLRKCYMKTPTYFSSESSMNSSLGLKGSSTSRDHSGPVFSALERSATQAAENGQFPSRMGSQPAGQLFSVHGGSATQAGGYPFPKRTGFQVTEGSAAQATTGGLFPKRLGFQVNEAAAAQAAEGNLFPYGMAVQTTSKLCRPQDSESIQFPRNLPRPPLANGRPEGGVPAQFSIDFRGSSSTTGQLQDSMPSQISKDLQRSVSTTGQFIPVAKVNNGLSQASDLLGRPTLKRGAIRPPPAARWVQRRKITPQPHIRPSMPYPTQTSFSPVPIPVTAPFHIKWQGSDRPPQPVGQKCLLCKRDLSFAPEGPVHQPTVPPAVAVLPCGHTFHDHCLQIITPEDQSKYPPCIPCAIGEN